MAVCSFVVLLPMLVLLVQSSDDTTPALNDTTPASNDTTPAPSIKKAVVPALPGISKTFVTQVRKHEEL